MNKNSNKKVVEREHYIETKECPTCHYKYSFDYDDHKIIEGKEKFIDIDLTATYEDDSDYYRTTNTLSVIMCPKCHILFGKL